MESSHFWPSVLHVALYKRCSSIFDLGPLTPKIYSPKFGTKSPISQLVWQIDRRCLGLLRAFRGSPIQWSHRKCCGADPCCHGNEIWAKIAHNSACPFKSLLFCFSMESSHFWPSVLQNIVLRFFI